MEIVIASGKGGTGKTFITSNLLYYINNILEKPAIGVDADIEAPDLVIALGGIKEILYEEDVYQSRKAVINYDLCNSCLNCINTCNFQALVIENDKPMVIEEFCEGCGACSLVCPVNAISYKVIRTGRVIACKTNFENIVVTGDLELGGRNSGELVYRIKNIAHDLCKKFNNDLVIVDAAPGISCPVISSLAGADYLIIVTEPTKQAFKGMERLYTLSKYFKLKVGLVINRYNLDNEKSIEIEKFCKDFGIEFLGKIPISKEIIESYVNMKPILSIRESSIKNIVQEIVENIITYTGLRK